MKMTDEHPDDFVAMAKRIEQARMAKDQELVRIVFFFCFLFHHTHTHTHTKIRNVRKWHNQR